VQSANYYPFYDVVKRHLPCKKKCLYETSDFQSGKGQVKVFWGVTPHSIVIGYQCFWKPSASILISRWR